MDRKKNLSTALSLAVLVAGMVMLAYASVPLYRLFCQVTGFGGTTQSAQVMPDKIYDRTITVRFNADVMQPLPWKFEPLQREVTVRVGEPGLAFYKATNMSDEMTLGTSTYNVVPNETGSYFMKVKCFCFEEQPLGPGESVNMPVSFFIDPEMMQEEDLDDVRSITLSYTFFAVAK
jgi:cytochrome c oxidase assembly protein subunit 11